MNKIDGRCRLLLATLLTAVIWMVVLPRIAKWRPIESMIRSHQAAGIDPSAMFYSDIEHLTYEEGMLRRGDQ